MRVNIGVPDGKKGKWEIRTFSVTAEEAYYHNLQEKGSLGRKISSGSYKALILHGVPRYLEGFTVMSNTPAEIKDHMNFIESATGNVLIFGLGLGLVVQALIDRVQVDTITVVEIDPDVIDLSGNFYEKISPKVRIHQGDAYNYQDDHKYDAIWFDIWNEISEENLEQMEILKDRYRKNSKVRMCWAERECRLFF